MREDVEFDAGGTTLRGWHYRDPGVQQQACIVMSHGFSAVKEMGLDDYADVFAAAGFSVLAYDNRNFGASDGEPRQEVDHQRQRQDYSHAIDWVSSQRGIDPERIGVWGTSYSGGIAITTGALDKRVKCVVAQVPYLHSGKTQARLRSREEQAATERLIDKERQSLRDDNAPTLLAVCSDDPNQSWDSGTRLSWRYFNHFVEAGRADTWRNVFTVSSLELGQSYDALAHIANVAPTPLMLIVAQNDNITPTEIALEAFDIALQPKSLVTIKGHHYRPYLEEFSSSSSAARDWFLEHL
ncbi:MAG: alpha/beta fold hydrolase [Pseudomonadota bacterium]